MEGKEFRDKQPKKILSVGDQANSASIPGKFSQCIRWHSAAIPACHCRAGSSIMVNLGDHQVAIEAVGIHILIGYYLPEGFVSEKKSLQEALNIHWEVFQAQRPSLELEESE